MGSTNIFLSGEGYGVREVNISPMVVFNILDHYSRRVDSKSRVIGTLLGRSTSMNTIDVVSSFPVPHSEDRDEVAVDIDYHKTMYDLHRRVDAGEEVIGWYATGVETDLNSVLIHEFYGRECANPVHLLIDAELYSEKANMRAFVSTAYKIDALALSSEFRPIPVAVTPGKAEKVGLDFLYRRTVANTTEEEDVQREIAMQENEIANLERALEKLLELLAVVGESVGEVVSGEKTGDPSVGRFLTETLAAVPTIDPADFKTAFGSSMRDLLMVVYLSKLTQTQLNIAERMLTMDFKFQ